MRNVFCLKGEVSADSRRADASKTPLVFVACGSFSPVTFLHLRMFEMARDHARLNNTFEVVGGYLSFVNDAYKKPGLAPSVHRYNMCKLACDKTSDWLMVDPWEARQSQYVPTARVLDHFAEELNGKGKGVEVEGAPGERRDIRIIMLAGSDLIQTMSQPGVWSEEDVRRLKFGCLRLAADKTRQLHHILGRYGTYIIERAESEIDHSLFSTSSVHSRSPLALYRNQIYLVPQLVRNDVSSTKVRLFVRKGMSVEYLIPGVVVKYIKRHGLYQDRDNASSASLAPTFSAQSHNSASSSRSTVTPPVDQACVEELERSESDEEVPSDWRTDRKAEMLDTAKPWQGGGSGSGS